MIKSRVALGTVIKIKYIAVGFNKVLKSENLMRFNIASDFFKFYNKYWSEKIEKPLAK